MSKDSFNDAQTEHGAFVRKLEGVALERALDFMEDGGSPIEAWRVAYGETVEQTAAAVGMHVEDYRDLEAGELIMDEDQAYDVAKHFGVPPYYFMGFNTSDMSSDFVKATLKFYDDLDGTSSLKDEVYRRLMDEALPFNTVEKMETAYKSARRSPMHDLVTAFTGVLLQQDKWDGEASDETAEDVIEDFSVVLEERHKELATIRDNAAAKRRKVFQPCDRLGATIFREVKEDQETWPVVFETLKILHKQIGTEMVVSYYRERPDAIGLNAWPRVKKDDFFDNGKFVGSWKRAHQRHADHLKRYFAAEDAYQKCYRDHVAFGRKLKVFETWASQNHGLINRMLHRRMIVSHPDFRHLRASGQNANRGMFPRA